MKKFFTLLLLTFTIFVSAQNLNNYKYALVPSRFDFLKEKNQFMINTYTKMFMQKYGFETYLDSEELPASFAANNCNKVFVDVISTGNFFQTKLKVVLKDCKNNILYTSVEGKSKEKDFNKSYNQALREAFNSFATLKHVYNGTEPDTYVEEKVAIVTSEIPVTKDAASLYAQPISNGFQLVNTEPKVVMKVYKTSVKDFFIAVRDNQNGVLFLKDSNWLFEYYKEGKLASEKIDVKF
jgi:hypothetical protein